MDLLTRVLWLRLFLDSSHVPVLQKDSPIDLIMDNFRKTSAVIICKLKLTFQLQSAGRAPSKL